jgi:tetratricopeptide (TPR) repeat protein
MIFATKIKYLIPLFLLTGSFTLAQNTLDEQFNLAIQLYEQEEYYDAVTELKRLLFFDETDKYIYEANELIGRCYKQGAKFSDAIRYFTFAEINSRNDEELYNTRIEIIRLNILRRTTKRAHKLLDSLHVDHRFSEKDHEINYWRGWTYIFADDWENAASVFSQVDSLVELAAITENIADDMYSVSLAQTLSYIIPGSGQIYTGEYISGIMSLGWNVLLGYLTINSFIQERIFDGIVIANFLWLRFYRGSLQNAENFAKEKNLIIGNEALNYLQHVYEGLKP